MKKYDTEQKETFNINTTLKFRGRISLRNSTFLKIRKNYFQRKLALLMYQVVD